MPRSRSRPMTLKLQEVFKINGVPTHTFVEPEEYT